MTDTGNALHSQTSEDTMSTVGSSCLNAAQIALQAFCQTSEMFLSISPLAVQTQELCSTNNGCSAGPAHPNLGLLLSNAILS